jgi:hypothetical protein
MKAEETFIRELESFMDTRFNDYTKNRIIMYLKNYAQNIPPVIIKQTVVKTYAEEHPTNYTKKFVTDEQMLDLANRMCEQRGIKIQHFLKNNKGRQPSCVIELRRAFCQKLYEEYFCNNSTLAKFFGVDHSTISFYLYGKNRSVKPSVKTVSNP